MFPNTHLKFPRHNMCYFSCATPVTPEPDSVSTTPASSNPSLDSPLYLSICEGMPPAGHRAPAAVSLVLKRREGLLPSLLLTCHRTWLMWLCWKLQEAPVSPFQPLKGRGFAPSSWWGLRWGWQACRPPDPPPFTIIMKFAFIQLTETSPSHYDLSKIINSIPQQSWIHPICVR